MPRCSGIIFITSTAYTPDELVSIINTKKCKRGPFVSLHVSKYFSISKVERYTLIFNYVLIKLNIRKKTLTGMLFHLLVVSNHSEYPHRHGGYIDYNESEETFIVAEHKIHLY